jgi:hypothetical protein
MSANDPLQTLPHTGIPGPWFWLKSGSLLPSVFFPRSLDRRDDERHAPLLAGKAA